MACNAGSFFVYVSESLFLAGSASVYILIVGVESYCCD